MRPNLFHYTIVTFHQQLSLNSLRRILQHHAISRSILLHCHVSNLLHTPIYRSKVPYDLCPLTCFPSTALCLQQDWEIARATPEILDCFLDFCIKLSSAYSVFSGHCVRRLLAALNDVDQLAFEFLTTCEDDSSATACLERKRRTQVRAPHSVRLQHIKRRM